MNSKKMLYCFILIVLCSCSKAMSQAGIITDFESCVAAGNKVLRSYPPQCVAPGVGSFTKQVAENAKETPPKMSDPLRYDSGCKDTCGDGLCAEMVCQAIGCPCAESKESCPKDCN